MIALLLYRALAHGLPWLAKFTSRTLARSLNVSESVIHVTGDLVLARVAAFEHDVGRRADPLMRRLTGYLRGWR